MSHPLLEYVSHRPYPVLTRSYALEQDWHDLLFIHWPLAAEVLRPLVPPVYEIDTFDGNAWVGVVPFEMRNVHYKNLPAVPFTSRFLELNVRTYVKHQGKGGVYFFSLDAENFPAVEVARLWYCLPYFHARMSCSIAQDGLIHYRSERHDKRGKPGLFEAAYRPTKEPEFSRPGSIEAFLTERYCLYTVSRRGEAVIGEIHHKP